jgi:hypothetical protein
MVVLEETWWSLIKEIMKKDDAARETEEILRDSRDTHHNRLVLRREINRRNLHGQEQRNLIWEEEEMSNGAGRLSGSQKKDN